MLKIFWVKNAEFMMSNRRGYDFWLWKPYVILSTLQDSEPNDVIIYMDAGCTLNLNSISQLLIKIVFRRDLLEKTRYEDEACLAEERFFLHWCSISQ